MAKSKKSRKKKGATSAGIKTGIAAGAATFVAGQAAKTVIKEIVEAGTERLFPRQRKSAGPDVGLLALRVLGDSGGGGSAKVVDLTRALRMNLLEIADVLRGLRRLRLVKFSDGHRAVRLTGQGRETLEMLRGPAEPGIASGEALPQLAKSEETHDADPRRDDGAVSSGDGSPVSAPPADEGA